MELQIKPLTEEYVDQVCILEEEAFSMPWHRESFLEMIRKKHFRAVIQRQRLKISQTTAILLQR